MPTVKGTASVADSRARTKALRKTRFPRNYRTSVDIEKVNKPVLTQWIEQKIASILGFDDEIVSSTAINLFLPSDNSCDPKRAHLDLAGFLGDETATFCGELWTLMLEAQASASGIPKTLLEQKKKEMAEELSKGNEPQRQQLAPYQNQSLGSSGKPSRFSRFAPDRSNPSGRSSLDKHEDATNKIKCETHISIEETSQEHTNGKEKGSGRSRVEDAYEKQNMDQFGRVLSTERSLEVQKHTSRNQRDRNGSRTSESSRHRRDRSRSPRKYNGREREASDHRRRYDNRYHGTDGDRRRPQDKRYHSNQYDDRSGYHDQYHRQYNHSYKNHHDRDRSRDQYRDSRDCRHEIHEMENLERRLTRLRKEYSGWDRNSANRSTHRIEDEMNDIQDRLYELEQRRRRYASYREDDRRRWSHRDRFPSYEYQREGRRKRSSSTNSESSRSVQSDANDNVANGSSDGSSRRSYSRSPERAKKNKNKSSKKRQRRRRSRSPSSSSERSYQS
ncbi:unnamed protein product [Pseudo-nitzschia multistriata]|uniref:PWI domain-containing protein n=1 Tax=Pseudo-nitzschia multistriata TaxID=183589 RepID=A0A448Z793_9STRA|nr:unnamed protein product [Pseudo-nitzschia multistriata]